MSPFEKFYMTVSGFMYLEPSFKYLLTAICDIRMDFIEIGQVGSVGWTPFTFKNQPFFL